MPKIYLSVPTISHDIHAWLALRIHEWTNRHDLVFRPMVGVQPVDQARNEIVKEFLQTDCTHLFMVDADTIPPTEAIEKLLNQKQPFISGLTPIIDGGNAKIRKYNAVDLEDKEILPNTGVHISRGVGASCVLIDRKVFDYVKPPYFRFIFEDDNGRECFVSEDIYFISKLIQANITPLVDSSVVCQHVKRCIF